MKRFATLLLAALAAPLPAHGVAPAAPKADATFGNTVRIIDPDGRSRKIWLTPDGRWTGLSRRGLDLAGKWKVRGEKVCLSQSKPRLPGSLCNVFPAEFGTAIESKDPSGKRVRLQLVKGQVRR